MRQNLTTMLTLFILMLICCIAVAVHKITNFNPCDKIELKRFIINKASERIAYIAGLLMLVIIIIKLIETYE